MRRIDNVTDLVSGLLLVGLALLALTLTWPLRLGSATQMGPGYVPRLLCYLQIGLGLMIIAQSLVTQGGPLEKWAPRPIVWVLAGLAFFTFAIERLGLVAAVIGLVLLSCLAHRGTRPLEAALLGIGLAVFSVLLFVEALGLPILVWPGFGD
ncbi:tripartite tricarboxylate transporter TctB family protein [Bosea caraganae]|uniref:Tripartite tricarboxylate transporter TctB family protein n=1 Tax=Bosea caraganae TaxID=2763117 RepID=A0A370KYT6_9HYPH|nr:tripartite tricarboxylate transporter TctB family protein [Bosea caraganae]RDJ19772.1 tripartite tricarboxylate transporter TctB family protein [Bosea caraganae]RDJ21125.1 tripartite tricarboxylate transporter TctB family protein [Bosea caraganae]